MKGKSKALLKTIICTLALLFASVGLLNLFELFNKEDKAYASVIVGEEEFSSYDRNSNVIMSVEKVAVADDYTDGNILNASTAIKSFKAKRKDDGVDEDHTYYYMDVNNGDKPKYVVENDKYVMLNNNILINGHYYSSSITKDDEVINMSQAVMFTLGSYVYDINTGKVHNNSEVADDEKPLYTSYITHLTVDVTKGGVSKTLPFLRRVYQDASGKPYEDYVCLLTQSDFEEGFYTFNVEYWVNGKRYTKEFSFYLIFESSYIGEYIPEGKTYSYSAKPTFSVYGDVLVTDNIGNKHYRLGDNTNYPTLTYDYTKYNMNYTYIANGKRSTYTYTYKDNGIFGKQLVCDIVSSGEKLEPVVYNLTSSEDKNFVVMMFSEVGTYNFNFNYIYTGDNKENAPDITESLKIDSQTLQINGFEAKYSKDGYDEAQLRYVTLSTATSDDVDLIVPNGYNKDNVPTGAERLQLMYSLNGTSLERVGNVIAQEDALANVQLAGKMETVVEGLTSDDITTFNTAKAEILADKINYVKTNQNSVWFSTNDSFVDGKSYYFYDKTSPDNFSDQNEIYRKEYDNTVSFVNPGYYLVLIKVNLTYEVSGSEESPAYYQVFAFQITSKTIVAKLSKQIAEGQEEEIGSNKFTNKNVKVTWEVPATFERQISAQYRVNNGTNATQIENGAILGADVAVGTYAKYTIEIKSEGEASITHTVTIDRQAISGIGLYEIETVSAGISSKYNVIRQTVQGHAEVTGLISDSAVTLFWDRKDSGAGISARYWRWDFVENKDAEASSVYGDSSTESWFSNKYQLAGNVTGPITGISTIGDLNDEVPNKYVYKNNGVYLFELTDDAGNSCYYMFVVDNTPAYLKVDSQFVNAEAKLFVDGVNVEISTHKAIKMFALTGATETELVNTIKTSTDGKDILMAFIELASFPNKDGETKNFINAGYYNNAYDIRRVYELFAKQSENSYLIVKNEYMYAYNNEKIKDTNLCTSIGSKGVVKRIEEDKARHGTSTIRNLYLIGENQVHAGESAEKLDYAKLTQTKSYAIVEINKDNSLGMAYYSNDEITANSISNATRLNTGLDIDGAHATNANNIAFTWTFGTGAFEVESIKYSYYALNPNKFVASSDYKVVGDEGCFYYTNPVFTDKVLYENGTFYADGGKYAEDTKGFVIINKKNKQTEPGLYVVTRKYINEVPESEEDTTELDYYFIVDRNGIVSTADANFAKSINISMLGGESKCNDFESIGYTTERFSYSTEEDETKYTIYLSTSKLPAKINIPVAKYFDGVNGSNYYAGKLTFTVYFVDRFDQLIPIAKASNTTEKLFTVDVENPEIKNGYYVLDLAQVQFKYKDLFLQSGNNKDWLCLPGDYIVAISDSVETIGEKAKEYIGFRIVDAVEPQMTISAALKQDADDKSHCDVNFAKDNYDIVTSAEVVKFDLNAYDNTNDYAQVDMNYLVVKQYYGNGVSYFINYPYSAQGGISLDTDSEYVTNHRQEGKLVSRTIYLDTKLIRDASGKIDVSKLDIPLYYEITIRYKISNSASVKSDEFKNCYYVYNDGVKETYYEKTYKVTIDRVAPTNNINNLEANDKLAKYYRVGDNTSLFAPTVTDNEAGIYFAKEYIDRDLEHLYAFAVTKDTPFDVTGLSAVYYNAFESVGELHWAPGQLPDGILANLTNVSTFGDLGFGADADSKYIEILELDEAGNTAQYLIYYCSDEISYNDVSISFGAKQYTPTGDSGEWTPLEFNVNNKGKSFTVFDVAATDEETGVEFASFYRGNNNETFYYFAFVDVNTSQIKFSYTTNGGMNLNNADVAKTVVDAIKAMGPGNYKFTILTQDANKSYSAIFDYYSSEDYHIDAKDLVSEDKNWITLNKANKMIKNIMYYARKVVIKEDNSETTYICVPQYGRYDYYKDVNGDGQITEEEIVGSNPVVNVPTKKNSTYQITTHDVFGKLSNYRFKASEDGDEFIKVESVGEFFKYNQTYYTYDETTLKFDVNVYTITATYTYNGTTGTLPVNDPSEEVSVCDGLIRYNRISGTITMLPETTLPAGATLGIEVKFYYNGVYETTYTVLLDCNTHNVMLKDMDNVSHDITYNFNVGPDFYSKVKDFGSSHSGTMNLSWEHLLDSQYTYSYRLHEIMNDGTVKITELDDVTNKVISTISTSTGKYYFEIVVRSNPEYTDGTSIYIGNKVYAFSVKATPSELYFVENEDGEAIAPNSTFKANEIPGLYQSNSLPNRDMPLYICTGDIVGNGPTFNIGNVIIDETRGISKHEICKIDLEDGYWFTLVEVRTATYSLYVGLLQAPKTDSIISNNLKYDSTEWNTALTLKPEPYVTKQDVKLHFTLKVSGERIKLKNLILLDVYYNGQFVKTYTPSLDGKGVYTVSEREYDYLIKGSGEYTFKFRDLAGNTQVFNAQAEALPSDHISLTVLRDVVVNVENNGKVTAPIDNAYYNGDVKVSVYNDTIYGSSLVNLVATRNNENYNYTKSGYTYTFTQPGTYRLKFSVDYKGTTLTKTLVFTIINPKECRENINLTTIAGYTITKVTKLDGTDVTTAFLNMIKESGRLLTYDTVIANSDTMNLSAGKQYFNIEYKVEAGVYPERSASFAFSMNNEIPNITCSIAPGETTTKGFTISYNAGIIYDQVGECVIYVNNSRFEIDENSADTLSTITITQKDHGTGDYYISLQTTSGKVISSFKVIVKEPLNAWAIVIIVVAVAAVSTVVITIIVLRNKMRIR